MPASERTFSILFVCMGNICRSPTAEAVFRHQAALSGMARRLVVESAGTLDHHSGKPPDSRAQVAARARGYDLSRIRARGVREQDFRRFDYILGMDSSNLAELRRRQPVDFGGYLGLFLDFAPWLDTREIPDPYYGGPAGFDHVLDLVEQGSQSLLAEIQARLRS